MSSFLCLIFFVLFCIFCRLNSTSGYDWTCSYYLADSSGMVINRVIWDKGIGWSLHGAWNAQGNGSSCISYNEFLTLYHRKFVEGRLHHFIDESPSTQYTCCSTQWHEYNKHACQKGISYEDWDAAVSECLLKFIHENLYVHQCRYDRQLECNAVESVTSEPIGLVGCRPNKRYCSDICFQDTSKTVCNAVAGRYVRPQWFGLRFKIPGIIYSENPIDPPNCHCGVDQRGLVYFGAVLLDQEGVVTSPTPVVSVEREEPITVYPEESNAVPIYPVRGGLSLNCTCPATSNDPVIDVRQVERDLEHLSFVHLSLSTRPLVDSASQNLQIFCYNKDGVLKKMRYRPLPFERYLDREANLVFDILRQNFFENNEKKVFLPVKNPEI